MPIEYSTGSIFDSGADVLVCPVNCVGVMGKGLALEFKKRFNGLWDAYKTIWKEGLYPGMAIHVQNNTLQFPPPSAVYFATTKDHWRDRTQRHWVNDCLANLRKSVDVRKRYRSIAIPALGCGLGGLDWADVKQLIGKHFADWPGRVIVFPPKGEET